MTTVPTPRLDNAAARPCANTRPSLTNQNAPGSGPTDPRRAWLAELGKHHNYTQATLPTRSRLPVCPVSLSLSRFILCFQMLIIIVSLDENHTRQHDAADISLSDSIGVVIVQIAAGAGVTQVAIGIYSDLSP